MGIGNRLARNSSRFDRANRGYNLYLLTTNIVGMVFFVLLAIFIWARSGSEGNGAALLFLGLAVLAAMVVWLQVAGRRRNQR